MRLAVVLVGGVINIALLATPLLIAGEMPLRAAPGFLGLLTCASLFYAADVQTVWKTKQNFPPLANEDTLHGADNHSACTALLILVVMLSAQTEHLFVAQNYTLPAWVWAVQAMGALLMLCGALLRGVAIAALGDRFVTALLANREIPFESQGVYGVVRHPSEAAILLFNFGASLTLLSGVGFAVFACLLLPLVVWRIRREDAFLRRVYSDSYARYAMKVAALAPGLY